MRHPRTAALAPLMALLLAACGADEAADTGSAGPQNAAPDEPAATRAPPADEKPWMVGLRWKGPADRRVELEVTYHLGEQLGTQRQTSQPRVQPGWSYLVGSPWVKGMAVTGRLQEAEAPVEVQIIRVRTVGDSPMIEGDDDVEVAEVLASMSVAPGGEASMQGGALTP